MAQLRFCPSCGSNKGLPQFYKNPLVNSKGLLLPYCKHCCTMKFKNYADKFKNDKAALWCVLAQLNIPFKTEVWEAVQLFALGAKNPDIVSLYMTGYVELGILAEGFWESDEMLFDFYGEAPKVESIDYKEEILKWGRFEVDGRIDEEAYRFLNNGLEEYTEDLGPMSPNLLNRYKDLVKAEWRKRKADESGDIQEIAKAQDNVNKMLALLKLNNFQDTNVSNEQRAFEKKIAMIEQFEPAECEDLKKYIDMVGYEKDKAQLMRSLRNAIAETRLYPDITKEES